MREGVYDMAQLINGKEISSQIKEEVKAQVAKLAEEAVIES